MKKLIRILLVTLALTVCVTTAELGWRVYNLENRASYSEFRAEVAERAIIAMSGVITSPTQMIQDVMPSAVAIEIYTGDILLDSSTMQVQPQVVRGSGVVTDEEGTILTAGHVGTALKASEKATGMVTFSDGRQYVIQKVVIDPNIDVALLRVDLDPNESLQSVRVASIPPTVGDRVWAIGSPFGYSFTVTSGIVSAYRDPNGLGQGSSIQVDVSLNPGNSGGPVFDQYGNLIGIAEGIVPGPVDCGVNFVISSSQITDIYLRLYTELTSERK